MPTPAAPTPAPKPVKRKRPRADPAAAAAEWRKDGGSWRASGLPFWSVDWIDGDTETVEGVEYRFDSKKADRICFFFETFLRHHEDPWAGRKFKLEPWQRRLARTLFGWLRPDGTRRFQTVFIFLPRKNGKSTFAAGLALYLTIADGEEGAQVYSAASDRPQAEIVFGSAKAMVELEPRLARRLKVYRRSITIPESRSRYVVVSADVKGKHGYNAHAAAIDELHAHGNRDLFDVLTTSMVARRQPMTIITTTAGFDRNHICYEQYIYAKRVAEGDAIDPTYLPVIFEAGDKDDWHSPLVWRKANPNFGVSILQDKFEALHRQACEIPGFENTFKRLHLNIWTEQASRWLPMDAFRECGGPKRDDAWWDSLRGRECYVGVDLSSVGDLTGMVGVIPDEKKETFDIICQTWVPVDTALMRARRDKVPYIEWARQGLITLTAGAATDQKAIRTGLHAWAEHVRIMEVAVDPWDGTQLIADLKDDGFEAFKHSQQMQAMTGPAKSLERVILTRQIRHGGHPVLDWCAKNVAIITDSSGNIKPAKDKSADRIDLIVCLVMALGRAMLNRNQQSVYERRGRGLLGI